MYHLQQIFIAYWKKFLKLIKFITQSYLSLLNLFFFLNDYFFRWLAYKSLHSRFSVLNYIMWFYNLFLYPAVSHIFHGPGFLGSTSKVLVQVLEVVQLWCIYFLTLRKEKCKNKGKVHKVHKIHHYTIIK